MTNMAVSTIARLTAQISSARTPLIRFTFPARSTISTSVRGSFKSALNCSCRLSTSAMKVSADRNLKSIILRTWSLERFSCSRRSSAAQLSSYADDRATHFHLEESFSQYRIVPMERPEITESTSRAFLMLLYGPSIRYFWKAANSFAVSPLRLPRFRIRCHSLTRRPWNHRDYSDLACSRY